MGDRRGLAAGIAVVALIAAGIAGVLTTGGGHREARRGGAAPSALAGPIRPAPAVQEVAFHGLQVTVPRSWTLQYFGCGRLVGGAVDRAFGAVDTVACSTADPSACHKYPVSTLVDMDYGTALPAGLAGRQVTLDGQPAIRAVRVEPGPASAACPAPPTYEAALVVPDRDVVVTAVSSRRAAVVAVIDTVSVVTTDSFGCRQHVPDLAAPSRPGNPAAAMVPGQPFGASVCLYYEGWNVNSVTLTAAERTKLVGILEALPAGSTPGRDEGSLCPQYLESGYIVHFRYPGRRVQVTVHISGCQPLTASNGTRTTAISHQLTFLLAGVANYDGTF